MKFWIGTARPTNSNELYGLEPNVVFSLTLEGCVEALVQKEDNAHAGI